jgi:RNA polymerase sigma-70 factor (ECF subfamily)
MDRKGDYSDDLLIAGCRRNDRHYQEALYRKYARVMYGICLSYTADRAAAQDNLQEAFIKVFRKIKDFRMEGSLEGWIKRVVVNTSLDFLRKKAKINQYIQDEPLDIVEEGDNEMNKKMNVQPILDKIANLPEGARAIFNLYAIEGYSHKEISKKLNITEGTSKSQYNRAKKLLQAWLQ